MDVIPATLTAFLGGLNETSVFTTGGLTNCKASFTADGFPIGSTLVDVLFSSDGGVSFPSQGTSSFGPAAFALKFAHTYWIAYEGPGQPTHVKARITAPLAFSATLTLTMQ
jgi:hypothetical protein